MTQIRYTGIVLVSVMSLGCGAKWNVSDQKFFKYQNKDLRVAGVIELTDESKVSIGSKGTGLKTRFYTDEYSTVVYETDTQVGQVLEESGAKGKREIFKLPVKAIRLGGTSNAYPRICAEMKIDDSNAGDWTRLGCVDQDTPPSESPTGGLGSPSDDAPNRQGEA